MTGTAQYGNLIVRRGVIGSLSWYQWWSEIRDGRQAALRTVTIQLLNEDRTATVLIWKFLRARPVSHRFSPLSGLNNEAFVETLEVAFERMEME